jgi:hypothetical protein
LWLADLAFPDHQDTPASRAQPRDIPFVAIRVGSQLRKPEPPMGFRHSIAERAFVPMPKASMNEHDGAVPGQHQFGPARKFTDVQSKSVAHPMDKPANGHFRLSIA